MKDDELKKQEVVNAESEKQNVTTLNEKLDFSDLENVWLTDLHGIRLIKITEI